MSYMRKHRQVYDGTLISYIVKETTNKIIDKNKYTIIHKKISKPNIKSHKKFIPLS